MDQKLEFDFDPEKEQFNIQKHGFSFRNAQEVFEDENGFTLVDKKHSTNEKRMFFVGQTSDGEVLTVRYTRRGSKIRIFGAAKWRKFKRLYDERAKS